MRIQVVLGILLLCAVGCQKKSEKKESRVSSEGNIARVELKLKSNSQLLSCLDFSNLTEQEMNEIRQSLSKDETSLNLEFNKGACDASQFQYLCAKSSKLKDGRLTTFNTYNKAINEASYYEESCADEDGKFTKLGTSAAAPGTTSLNFNLKASGSLIICTEYSKLSADQVAIMVGVAAKGNSKYDVKSANTPCDATPFNFKCTLKSKGTYSPDNIFTLETADTQEQMIKDDCEQQGGTFARIK